MNSAPQELCHLGSSGSPGTAFPLGQDHLQHSQRWELASLRPLCRLRSLGLGLLWLRLGTASRSAPRPRARPRGPQTHYTAESSRWKSRRRS